MECGLSPKRTLGVKIQGLEAKNIAILRNCCSTFLHRMDYYPSEKKIHELKGYLLSSLETEGFTLLEWSDATKKNFFCFRSFD
jgi:hypothetical protein